MSLDIDSATWWRHDYVPKTPWGRAMALKVGSVQAPPTKLPRVVHRSNPPSVKVRQSFSDYQSLCTLATSTGTSRDMESYISASTNLKGWGRTKRTWGTILYPPHFFRNPAFPVLTPEDWQDHVCKMVANSTLHSLSLLGSQLMLKNGLILSKHK